MTQNMVIFERVAAREMTPEEAARVLMDADRQASLLRRPSWMRPWILGARGRSRWSRARARWSPKGTLVVRGAGAPALDATLIPTLRRQFARPSHLA